MLKIIVQILKPTRRNNYFLHNRTDKLLITSDQTCQALNAQCNVPLSFQFLLFVLLPALALGQVDQEIFDPEDLLAVESSDSFNEVVAIRPIEVRGGENKGQRS